MRDDFTTLLVQSEQHRVEFLRTELSVCSTLIELATTEHDLGHQGAAERSIQYAQEGYSTVIRFLSAPSHTQRLTTKEFKEFTDGTPKFGGGWML